jgi:probable rRNA maturation factor
VPVSIVVQDGPFRGVARREVVRRAEAMLRQLKRESDELSIVLTTDEQIKFLNRDYRHKDRATDVLAFAIREGEFATLAGDLLGDVIISVPTAARQAKEKGHDTLDEVVMLLAHGLLHLLGWDHDTVAKDKRMRVETDKLVRASEAVRPAKSRGGMGAKRTTVPKK